MKTIHDYFHECTNHGPQFEYSWFYSWTVNQREFNHAMVRKLLSTLEYVLSVLAGGVRRVEGLRGRMSEAGLAV